MKSIVALGIIAVLAIIVCSMCVTRVEQGYEGIIINNVGSSRGIVDQKGVTGYIFHNPVTQHVVTFPIYMQRVVWCASEGEGNAANEEISVNSKEGTKVKLDVAINWQVIQGMGGKVYVQYKRDADQLTNAIIKDAVRSAMQIEASQVDVMTLYTTGKGEFASKVEDRLNQKWNDVGFKFGTISINEMRLTDSNIEAAINQAITQTQKTKAAALKVAEIQAEADQKIAAATGEAKSNQIVNASITDKLIKMRKLEIEKQAIDKWNGTPPTYLAGSNSSFGFIKDIGQ